MSTTTDKTSTAIPSPRPPATPDARPEAPAAEQPAAQPPAPQPPPAELSTEKRAEEHPIVEKLGLEERPWLFLLVGVLAVVLAFVAMVVLTKLGGGGGYPPP